MNSRDIAALNRARAVLKRLEESAWRRSLSHYDPLAPVTAWDLGRLSEAACVADDAILHVLATARANCKVKMTDAQLFGPAPVEEPDHEQTLAPDEALETLQEPEDEPADPALPEAPAEDGVPEARAEQDGVPDASAEPEGAPADAAPPEAPAEQDGVPDAQQDGHRSQAVRRGRRMRAV